MNNHIGIPSGWEEIAAYCYAIKPHGISWRNVDYLIKGPCAARDYIDYDHDWRVEE